MVFSRAFTYRWTFGHFVAMVWMLVPAFVLTGLVTSLFNEKLLARPGEKAMVPFGILIVTAFTLFGVYQNLRYLNERIILGPSSITKMNWLGRTLFTRSTSQISYVEVERSTGQTPYLVVKLEDLTFKIDPQIRDYDTLENELLSILRQNRGLPPEHHLVE